MGCFSKPKVEAKSTMDPMLQSKVMYPFFDEMSTSLFGPGQGSSKPGCFGNNLRASGCFGSRANEQQGAFGGDTSWVYPGQRVAPTSPLQQQAFDWASQYPGQVQAMQGMGLGMLGQAPNFDATRAYTGRLWNEDIAPSVMERFAGLGTADAGGAQRGLQRAGEQTALGMASQLAPMELQARLGAANLLPSLGGMGSQGMQTTGLMGGEQRAIGQQGMDANMARFYESQPWNHPMLQYMFPSASASQMQLVNKPGGMGYSMLTGMAPAVGTAVTGGLGGMASGMGFGQGMQYGMFPGMQKQQQQ